MRPESDRFAHGKERYITYIRVALFNQLRKDNVVYHGFVYHFFVEDIPRVLNVRIISGMEDRIEIVMERANIPSPSPGTTLQPF
jgi:hypothetical protein